MVVFEFAVCCRVVAY